MPTGDSCPGCGVRIRPDMAGCVPCWRRLPDVLRSAIRDAGRDRHWPEHGALVDEAISWLRANRVPGHQPRPAA